MYIEWSYAAYLGLSVVLTIWVARALHSRGRVFLVDHVAPAPGFFGAREELGVVRKRWHRRLELDHPAVAHLVH